QGKWPPHLSRSPPSFNVPQGGRSNAPPLSCPLKSELEAERATDERVRNLLWPTEPHEREDVTPGATWSKPMNTDGEADAPRPASGPRQLRGTPRVYGRRHCRGL